MSSRSCCSCCNSSSSQEILSDDNNNGVHDDKRFRKPWLFKGSKILSRWSNGLWYVGVIRKVDNISRQCLVEYEDKSLYWTHLKDIHKQLAVGINMSDSDILCEICGSGTSITPNQIVLCDICNQGYHQKCHPPKIPDKVLNPNVPWSCRTCVFALATKEGGAEKIGTFADQMRQMKMCLAYDLNALNWDEEHLVNDQNVYCYCGGPGEYHSKMLQCNKCLQWFHEACIQTLETQLLYGDHYYTFSCAVCNKGKEVSNKIKMKWNDLVAIVIYNLNYQQNKRFFELNPDIVSFITKNAHMLKLNEDISQMDEIELTEKIIAVLDSNKEKFICGKEVKRKSTMWALRLAFPFVKPLLFAPPFGTTSQSSFSSLFSEPPVNSASRISVSPSQTSPFPFIYGACRKGASASPVKSTHINPIKNESAKRNVFRRVRSKGPSNNAKCNNNTNCEDPLLFAPPFATTSQSSISSLYSGPPVNSASRISVSPSQTSPFPFIYGACRKGASAVPVKSTHINPIKKESAKKNVFRRVQSKGTGNNAKCNNNTNCDGSLAETKNAQQLRSKRKRNQSNTLNSRSSVTTADPFRPPESPRDALELIPQLENYEGINNPFYDLSDDVEEPAKKQKRNVKKEGKFPASSADNEDEDYKVIRDKGNLSKLTIKRISHGIKTKDSPANITQYFENISEGEKVNILARRMTTSGKVEYLIERCK